MSKLRDFIRCNITTIFISISFIVLYVINIVVGDNIVFHALSGSGFKKLNGEVYRIVTASFLHGNLLHLTANIIALLCVGSFLEKRFGSLKMLLLYICLDIIASISFYGYMNECTNGNGSSIVIYALFAVFLILKLRYPEQFTYPGCKYSLAYMIVYFYVAGFFGNYSTMIIHGFSFAVGLAAGLMLLRGYKRNKPF